jgi:endonuclease/exonuclease/phosphatase family metal-dependent hydrolase
MNDSDKPALIINIYNPNDNNLITPLQQCLYSHIHSENYSTIIIAGDFNLHLLLWNLSNYDTHDQQAEELAELMGSYGLTQMLPKGTITYPTAGTMSDLVWGNQRAEQAIIKCQIAEYNDHSSDHRPIEIILDLLPITSDANKHPTGLRKNGY